MRERAGKFITILIKKDFQMNKLNFCLEEQGTRAEEPKRQNGGMVMSCHTSYRTTTEKL